MVGQRKALLAALPGLCLLLLLSSCKASDPGTVETELADELKEMTIGGKDWENPTPDTQESVKTGSEHFRHHCQVCHGLDGHGTGVPFAAKMSPPVPDLGLPEVQDYTDGQLKWIIENGIRFTGMPGWKGIVGDEEMWLMVRYIRNLPQAGALGPPDVYAESADASEGAAPEDAHHHEHQEDQKIC